MQFHEACTVLGVVQTATMSDIKVAYRQLVREWHPDRNPDRPDAEARFRLIQEAYEYMEIVYAEQRRLQTQNDRLAPIERPRLPHHLPIRGSDVRVTIELSLFDAYRGSQRGIEFDDYEKCERCGGTGNEPNAVMVPCPYCPDEGECSYCGQLRRISDEPCLDCGGAGTRPYRSTVRVAIPRSVRDGAELKTSQKGQWGQNGRGDLYVRVRIHRHPQLRREGDDLWVNLPVDVFQAIFGGSVWLPGLDGSDYQIAIPAGSSSGTQLRLEGKGFNRKDDTRGDLCGIVMITVPHQLTERQRYFYEQLLHLEAEHYAE